jgi:hypothetical protein
MKMKHPTLTEGTALVEFDREQFPIVNGIADVPPTAAEHLRKAGWTEAKEEEAADEALEQE